MLYLRRLQHSAFLSLSRQLQSAEAWRLLCHSSLALLILYNRRRECEVSKLTITEYRARVTPQCPVPVPPGAPPALTPLEASLSPFERLVLPHLPRVGVQGKRGRVQPLILPPHCEPCLELLLQTRQDVGVDPANPYVFARPYHSPATPLRGTDLLRSLARSSGTRNPRALTQTRVRRQVAILTQLLLLGEGEEPGQPGGSAVERLEHFLEREYHVTQNCAGIGQDPGLMGRVGRVVLCGERDGVLFRGMSLNHICLELDGEMFGWLNEWMSGTCVFLCCPKRDVSSLPVWCQTSSGWKKDYDPSSSFECECEMFMVSSDRLNWQCFSFLPPFQLCQETLQTRTQRESLKGSQWRRSLRRLPPPLLRPPHLPCCMSGRARTTGVWDDPRNSRTPSHRLHLLHLHRQTAGEAQVSPHQVCLGLEYMCNGTITKEEQLQKEHCAGEIWKNTYT